MSLSDSSTALSMNLLMGRTLLRVTRRYCELSIRSLLVDTRAGLELVNWNWNMFGTYVLEIQTKVPKAFTITGTAAYTTRTFTWSHLRHY